MAEVPLSETNATPPYCEQQKKEEEIGGREKKRGTCEGEKKEEELTSGFLFWREKV